jgi:hypothetical protein
MAPKAPKISNEAPDGMTSYITFRIPERFETIGNLGRFVRESKIMAA